MKKICLVLVAVMTVVAFTNCKNNKTKSPGDAAKEYAEHLRDRDYDRFVDRIAWDDDWNRREMAREVRHDERTARREENRQNRNNHPERAHYSRMLRDQVEPYVQQKGGIRDVSVVSQDVARDGKSANVVLRQAYNNGQSEDIAYDMLLVDNEWKVKVGPNKEVWKTRLPDGTNVSFKFKDNDSKDVFKEHIGDERDFVKVKETDDKFVVKVKDDGDKDVLKVKDKGDEIVIKEKHNGDKDVTRIDKEDL